MAEFGDVPAIFADPAPAPAAAPAEAKRLDFERPLSKAELRNGGKRPKPKKPLHERIPRLPDMQRLDPAAIQAPEQRQIACVNMRLDGAPFHEIAKELDYASAESARAAYYSALANMHPPEDIETLRQAEGLRAEKLFKMSLAMASADYFIATELQWDEDEQDWVEVEVRIANTDRLRWHEQAGKDLALHATIMGAKAPARMEINASSEEINRLVTLLALQEGGGDHEADVFEMDAIEGAIEDAVDAEIVED